MSTNNDAASSAQDQQNKLEAVPEVYETPRLIETGSLRNVLGKSHGSTEIVNRFRIAGHKS